MTYNTIQSRSWVLLVYSSCVKKKKVKEKSHVENSKSQEVVVVVFPVFPKKTTSCWIRIKSNFLAYVTPPDIHSMSLGLAVMSFVKSFYIFIISHFARDPAFWGLKHGEGFWIKIFLRLWTAHSSKIITNP